MPTLNVGISCCSVAMLESDVFCGAVQCSIVIGACMNAWAYIASTWSHVVGA